MPLGPTRAGSLGFSARDWGRWLGVRARVALQAALRGGGRGAARWSADSGLMNGVQPPAIFELHNWQAAKDHGGFATEQTPSTIGLEEPLLMDSSLDDTRGRTRERRAPPPLSWGSRVLGPSSEHPPSLWGPPFHIGFREEADHTKISSRVVAHGIKPGRWGPDPSGTHPGGKRFQLTIVWTDETLRV